MMHLIRLLCLVVGMLVIASCGWMARRSVPAKLDASAIATMGRPGSVLIQTWFQGTLQAPEVEVDEGRLRAALQAFLAGREGGATDRNVLAFADAVIPKLPGLCDTVRNLALPVDSGSSGSGMILTPEGHVVTNAHVVDFDEDDVVKLVLRDNPNAAVRNVSVLEKVLAEANPQVRLTASKLARVRNGFILAGMSAANISGLTRSISVILPGRRNGKMVPLALACKVVVAGKVIPKKDVAVIACDGNGNLPTVALAASSKSVSVGDDLYVIGYPGAATYNSALSRESIVESSLTIGHVSALKSMAEGWSVIQTDAAVSHGNSGGPAFNSQGQAIGIVTFGAVDSSGNEVAGFNYVVPADVIHEFLRAGRVTPRMSAFSTAYNEASAAYYAGDASTAKKLLKTLDSGAIGGTYVRQLEEKLGVPASASPSSETIAKVVQSAKQTPVATDDSKPLTAGAIAIYSIGGIVALGALIFGFMILRAWARW